MIKTTNIKKILRLRYTKPISKNIFIPSVTSCTTGNTSYNNSNNKKILQFNNLIELIKNTKNKRLYSTGPIIPPVLNIQNNNINNLNKNIVLHNKFVTKPIYDGDTKIDPYYISGLTQADGSFNCGISISKSKFTKTLGFKPIFDICLDIDSISVLIQIQKYFGCGRVSVVRSDNSVHFLVSNLQELKENIIPHFIKYPVFFNKLHAFELLVQIVNLMDVSQDLRTKNKPDILRLAISMNSSSRRTPEQMNTFYNVLGIPVDKIPSKIEDKIKTINSKITPAFLTGMIDGDGSFYVIFTNKLKIIPAMKQCYGKNCAPFEEYFKKYLGDIGQVTIQDNIRI